MQAAKSNRTLNVINSQLRDPTAYGLNPSLMRRRSLHSIANERVDKKEDSLVRPKGNSLDSSQFEKSTKSDKPIWVSGGADATTIVKNLLEQRNNKSQKHYKLTEIIANEHFLEKCYTEIMSKPGNMTRGSTNETLDGINWN